MKHNNKGFTVLELTIVFGIISTLTGMLWASYNKIVEKYGNDTSALQELKEEYNFYYYDDLTLPEPIEYKIED